MCSGNEPDFYDTRLIVLTLIVAGFWIIQGSSMHDAEIRHSHACESAKPSGWQRESRVVVIFVVLVTNG